MNKQRKVLITITYNEMGIIIDTKAEEVAQPNLQPTCNQLATDCISRQSAIDAINALHDLPNAWLDCAVDAVMTLPSAQPEPAIPLQWIESQIEWLKSLDNAFSTLTAVQISAMVDIWKGEQDG